MFDENKRFAKRKKKAAISNVCRPPAAVESCNFKRTTQIKTTSIELLMLSRSLFLSLSLSLSENVADPTIFVLLSLAT